MRKIVMRFLILMIIVIIGVTLLVVTDKTKTTKLTPLFEIEEFKKVKEEYIREIIIVRNTEAGQTRTPIHDEKEIKDIYNQLKKIKVGQETTSACDDNTTIYLISLSTNDSVGIEIECDWLVLNNKRYLIEKE